jgi:hypothetical protein
MKRSGEEEVGGKNERTDAMPIARRMSWRRRKFDLRGGGG